MSRIDDAVKRILREKFRLGLFEHPFADRSHSVATSGPTRTAPWRGGRRRSRRRC